MPSRQSPRETRTLERDSTEPPADGRSGDPATAFAPEGERRAVRSGDDADGRA